MNTDKFQLKNTRTNSSATAEELFDIKKCIFCQHNDTFTVITTENGRRKIIEAPEKSRDKIYTRLSSIEADFVYHVTNKCYKGYTLKKTLESISEQSSHIETRDSTLNEKEEPAKKRLR